VKWHLLAILALLVAATPPTAATSACERPALTAPWCAGPADAHTATWHAEGLSAVPAVVVEGGTGDLANCEDDGRGAETLRCVVWAQGAWSRVVAGGAVLAQRCPCVQWLGMVGR
jgi:hypothetical protein